MRRRGGYVSFNSINLINPPAISRCFPALGSLALLPLLCVSALAKDLPVAAKWGRFEHTFKSSVTYPNAPQDARLTVIFLSPLGETNQAEGFWDGGRTWRVRFSPYQAGHWTFKSACSDTANKGLHDQSGEFVCSAPTGPTPLNQHGRVRVALDRRHLEYADFTALFWLADTAWSGARVSEPKEWQLYARTRAAQGYTAVHWTAAPGADAKKGMAFTGQERITINPQFFQRLDAKLDTLTRAGLVSAITPLWEMASDQQALPEDQALLLIRYIVARWDADPVMWTLAPVGGGPAAARWKRIGQAIFGQHPHSPVMLYAGNEPGLLDEFRDQGWVDLFGYQSLSDTSDPALKAAQTGRFSEEWAKEPTRPLIPFLPSENASKPSTQGRWTADDIRHAAYWNLLVTVPAGLTYGGQGVVDWDRASGSQRGQNLPLWQRSLFLPAAKQLAHLAKFMNSIDFWRLRPEPNFVTAQPGGMSPARFIAAAGAETKNFTLVYVPEDRTLEIYLEALPPSPSVTWFNPRGQENSPAVAVVGGRSCQFPTPEPGDWLLVMKAGK
jgi:hypothetical protein